MNRLVSDYSLNLPEIIKCMFGPLVARGLNREHGGVICDPRSGHAESRPSFSVYKSRAGVWRWKRHGDDEASGDIYDFLIECGFSHREALKELCCLAGVRSPSWQPSNRSRAYTAPDPFEQARRALSRCAPLTPKELVRVTRLFSSLAEQDQASQNLKTRGLFGWAGLQVGKLRSAFRTRDGRTLAHAGALCFLLTGPDGKVWGAKIRNLGSAEELAAAGFDRYVYRLAGHGAPAWCSPFYGQGSALLMIEGELSGAAAACGLSAAGLALDVQGLAGAGGVPHLDGMAGRVIYLYADPDAAGAACLERVGRIAQAAGAAEVRVLAPLGEGDFCDLLGQLGPVAFGHRLQASLEAAQIRAFDSGPRPALGPSPVLRTMLSGTAPSIWGQQNTPSQGVWGKRRRLF